jgi:hypothetical protein
MFRPVALATAFVILAWSPAAQAQVKLEYKFNEGSKTKTETRTKFHQVLTLSGMNVETESDQVVVSSSEVGKRQADGTLPMVQKIDTMRVQVKAQGQDLISYDSANPPEKKDNGPFGFVVDMLKALVGSSYTVSLDKNNKFIGVEGIQQVLDKATGLDPKAAEGLKQQLDSEKIKKGFEQEHASLPPILVRPGETWDRTEVLDLEGGQSLTFQKRYEYKGPVQKDGKTYDQIAVKATAVVFALDPNANAQAKVEKSDLKIESSEGTILFDRQAGRAVEGGGKTQIKGTMTLTIMGKEFPNTGLDLTIETHHDTKAL